MIAQTDRALQQKIAFPINLSHFSDERSKSWVSLSNTIQDSISGFIMSQKHIILRSQRALTRDPSIGVLATPRGMEVGELQVEIEEINRSRVAELSQLSDVVAVAPAMPMQLIAPVAREEAVTAAATGSTWGVKAVKADTSPFTGDGIIVAVLDTGIDAKHPAFAGVNLVQKDFTGEGDGDKEGHGTHCAGTIFGRDVDGNRIGVAPGVKQALIGKVLGGKGGSSEIICNAMMWAIENGAHVISMSLGIDFPGYVQFLTTQGLPVELATSQALADYRANTQLFGAMAGLIEARSRMTEASIVVAAAGNESQRNRNLDWEISVAPPAVAEGIISVAAVGESPSGLVVAPFSNTGANIAGPGVKILSAKTGGGLVAFSGTSMATPHVAGLAALWAEKLKKTGRLNSLVLTSRLIASATDEGMQAGFDPFDIGAGIVRAPQS
jgi:subtilisin family serine protease